MMVTREQQVEQIATMIREWEDALLAYGGTLRYADAEESNAGEGFTLEFLPSDPGARAMGHIIRQEGVSLSDTELRRAWALAHDEA